MSTFTELFGAAGGGGRLKFLYVTSSTVWTPPAGLLAAGGVIYRELWGGGGGAQEAGSIAAVSDYPSTQPGYAADANTGNGGIGRSTLAGTSATAGQSGGALLVWVEKE